MGIHRTLCSTSISCDSDGCRHGWKSTILSSSEIAAISKRDGWVKIGNDWLCPSCAAKKAEAAR